LQHQIRPIIFFTRWGRQNSTSLLRLKRVRGEGKTIGPWDLKEKLDLRIRENSRKAANKNKSRRIKCSGLKSVRKFKKNGKAFKKFR